MADQLSRWRRIRRDAEALWSGTIVGSPANLSRPHKFAHFWVLVWKSFRRNRCPVRASALAYASLLALIPMLAVIVSVTSSILKNEGEERIDNFVVKFVSDLVPPGTFAADEPETNSVTTSGVATNIAATHVENVVPTNAPGIGTNTESSLADDKRVMKAR